jgi:hypothetical protein
VDAAAAAAAAADDDDDNKTTKKKKKKVLRRTARGFDPSSNCLDSMESVFTQYITLSCFPAALYAMSAFHSGPGQITWGTDRRRKADLTLALPPDAEAGTPHTVLHADFHGQIFHGSGHHLAGCPQAHTGGSSFYVARRATGDEDELKAELAAALTAVEPDKLAVRYHVVHECDLMHSFAASDEHREELLIPGSQPRKGPPAASARALLLRDHPEDALLGLGGCDMEEFTQESLVARILAEKSVAEGGTFGGFVLIRGGVEGETEDGLLPGAQGFCHQRRDVEPDQVGPFTELQARMMAEAERGSSEEDCWRALLRKRGSGQQTLCRSSFHPDGETLGLDYFRFLLKERKLKDFEISHLLFYRETCYLGPFLRGMLQRRHDLKLRGGDALKSNLLKLVINGFYGYSALESCNFTRTSVISEKTLHRDAKRRDALLTSEDVVQITLLGAVVPEKLEETPNLLYAITRRQPKARIENIAQFSCCILSNSRRVFLGKVLKLLRYLDPAKAELAYTDTDSAVWACHTVSMVDALRPEYSPEAMGGANVLQELFEMPGSPAEQSGKFKVEGVYALALFRTGKSYYLRWPTGDGLDEVLSRFKSIPTKVRKLLDPRHYGQDPRTNGAVARMVTLRPSRGLEMSLLTESRSLSHCLNYRRFATVSSSSSSIGSSG